jgi:putative Mg2+ transporter-C (MgtC) family protein
MTEYLEILLRLILAFFSGGFIGLQREQVHKPAGMRTHMLVCIGSALFVLVALESLPTESARIIAGIATGVGFLGAGTIFRSRNEVHGLTTAASIWVVAALGLAIGMGFYLMSVTSLILILIVLQFNKSKYIEMNKPNKRKNKK